MLPSRIMPLCKVPQPLVPLRLPAWCSYYPVNTVSCCSPALLLENGDAWELERCGCHDRWAGCCCPPAVCACLDADCHAGTLRLGWVHT